VLLSALLPSNAFSNRLAFLRNVPATSSVMEMKAKTFGRGFWAQKRASSPYKQASSPPKLAAKQLSIAMP